MRGAVIYCRVSTVEQVDNFSLATQEDVCRGYCRREGLRVERVFLEKGESAKTADRTELQRMLTYCREHRSAVAFVVVYDLSRFSRETSDHYALKTLLGGWGVSLRSATQPIDDSPIGGLLEGITASVAMFENRMKAQRTKEGMRTALERGRWTFKPPVGYRRGIRGGPSLELDPERAPLVREAFENFARGCWTVAEIRERLRVRGLTTHRGAAIALPTVHSMLRCPVYVGRVEVPAWGVSVPGDFEALVPETTFNLVQVRLGTRTRTASYTRDNPDFPLRGLVRCNGCGNPLTAGWSKGKYERYGYYFCYRAGCRRVRVGKDALEAAFLEFVRQLQPRREYVRLFNAIVLDVWRKRQGATDRERVRLRARVDTLRARLRRLADLLLEDSIDRATYTAKRDELRHSLAVAEVGLEEARNEQLDVEAILAFAEDALTDMAGLWERAALKHRQRLQAAILPEGLVFEPEGISQAAGFRTPVTGAAFRILAAFSARDSRMASPTRFELVLPP